MNKSCFWPDGLLGHLKTGTFRVPAFAVPGRLHFIFLLFAALLAPGKLYAQSYYVKGNISDSFYRRPAGAIHIIINNGEAETISDMEGNFNIARSKPIVSLKFKNELYRELTIYPADSTKSRPLRIKLSLRKLFDFPENTSPEAQALIKKVLERRAANNPLSKKPFSYYNYDKLVIYTDSLLRAKKMVNSVLRVFNNHKLSPFEGDHNVFMLETSAKSRYLDELHRSELITALRVSGIDEFSASAPLNRLQSFSVYDNYLVINSSKYISPLAGNPFRRYSFTVSDTVNTPGDTLYIVKYAPLPGHYPDAVRGWLHISRQGWAVQYAEAVPVLKNKLNARFVQSYTRYNSTDWFPNETYGEFAIENFMGQGITIFGRQKSRYHKVSFREKMNRADFSDVVLDFDSISGARDSAYWQQNRMEPLTRRDSNTFAFYDMQGRLRNFGYMVNLGERLYQGQINFNHVGIDLNRVISFNLYENLRLGIGIHSNYLMNSRLRTGGYFGYGLNDERWKYGFDLGYNLLPKYALTPGIAYSNDLSEPGPVTFFSDKKMYGSESLRYLQLPRLDIAVCEEFNLTAKPVRNVNIRLAAIHTLKLPRYDYTYKDVNTGSFEFMEFRLAGRFSPGEQFARLAKDKISLGTKYPELWLQYTKAINALGGDYAYNKVEGKINYTFRILGTGNTGVQLSGGIVSGDVPYTNLFNGRGSYRGEASFVTFNSFETMRYNEFAFDRYAGLFLTHNFMPIYIPGYPFLPYFTLMHNTGLGSLRNAGLHSNGIAKALKGPYFETGFFVNDAYVFNVFGLKSGVGIGFFTRYGENSLPGGLSKNYVLKFALTFSI
ncbi:MAG: DUF5686 family protein [Bacteroidota bacterium]